MRKRFRLYKRKKGGRYYIHDEVTGKQDSLHTSDRATAVRLFHSRQEAEQQPAVNLQIARAYLAATGERRRGSSEPAARRAAGRNCVTDSPVLMPVAPAVPASGRYAVPVDD
jgi:hypothetical protein